MRSGSAGGCATSITSAGVAMSEMGKSWLSVGKPVQQLERRPSAPKIDQRGWDFLIGSVKPDQAVGR